MNTHKPQVCYKHVFNKFLLNSIRNKEQTKIKKTVSADYGYSNRSFLIVKIVDILRKYVQQRIEETETLDQKRFKVAVDLCIPGIISVYMNWFTNSYDYSIEELSSLLTDFILNGIQKNWPGN